MNEPLRQRLAPIWRAIARANVLVTVADLGAEMRSRAFTGRLGWLETFEQLGLAFQCEPTLLDRVHELSLYGSVGPASASVHELSLPDRPLQLRLHWGFESGGPEERGPLTVPRSDRILEVLGTLPPRQDLERHRFDNRFLLFAAGLGFGVKLPGPDTVDQDRRRHFHLALAALGGRVAGIVPAPRPPESLDRPADPGVLQNLQDALCAAVDPGGHPQIEVRQMAPVAAGFDETVAASFPGGAFPSRLYAFFHYCMEDGRIRVPDLDRVDRSMGDWIDRRLRARGTPEEASSGTRPFRCEVV